MSLDAVLARVPEWNKGGIARYGRYFCDPDRRQDVEAYFGPLVGDLQGGPRALAGALPEARARRADDPSDAGAAAVDPRRGRSGCPRACASWT